MDIDLDCDCGNPACHARTEFRKGYVNIRHPDGREEVRWDWFHIFSVDYETGDKKSRIVELMAPPREARRLMWFLILNYLPGITWCYYELLRIRCLVSDTLWSVGEWWRHHRSHRPAD